jgi:hypothetical protein
MRSVSEGAAAADSISFVAGCSFRGGSYRSAPANHKSDSPNFGGVAIDMQEHSFRRCVPEEMAIHHELVVRTNTLRLRRARPASHLSVTP